jgi:predicted nucleic acid-binding protein
LSVVFDTEALLAYYLGEPGGEKVLKLLNQVYEKKIKGYINIVNLTEFCYILYRRDPKIAEEKERNLRTFGLKIVPVTDDRLWRGAAKIKGENPVSLADAFAAATAKTHKAKLATGRDVEFQKLNIPLIKIR